MKRLLCGAICAIILLALSACTPSKPTVTSFEAMDTLMTLTVYGDDKVGDQLRSRIEELDSLLDVTDESSELYRLNREKNASVSPDTAALLNRSLQLSEALGGSFDLTVCPAIQAWGFTSGNYRIPDDDELKKLSEMIDYRQVTLDGDSVKLSDNTRVDPGAVAKGYAADCCGKLLEESKAQAAVLNLGGTIRLYGKKPDGSRFKVGVADPGNPAAYFGYLSLDGGTVATSGGYERYFERDGRRYIHILDPKTAAPVENGVQSVTIITDDGTAADAMSTALFVMGLDQAVAYYRAHPNFDFVILDSDGTISLTEGIADRFTLAQGYDLRIETIN